MDQEPSHVAEFRDGNPSLQHANFMLFFSVSSFTFFISLCLRFLGRYVYLAIFSPCSKYSGFSFWAVSGKAVVNLFQLSGLILYVELVMCRTPIEAKDSISCFG